MLPILLRSQDTIIKKSNEIILCKITKVTSANIFYTENKIGKSISINETGYCSKAVPSSSPTINIASECDVKKSYDKFEDETIIKTESFNWAYVKKYTKKGNVSYYLQLHAEAFSANYYKTGVIILFENGIRLEKPNAKIDCTFRQNSMYDYYSFFELTAEDLKTLSENNMTDFQLYLAKRSIPEKKAIKLKENIACLITQ